MRKDEKVARVEKEKIEERAKAAEREHRLNILRSRANIDVPIPQFKSAEGQDAMKERFELFPSHLDKLKDKNDAKPTDSQGKSKFTVKSEDDVLADHTKNDPLFQRGPQTKKLKGPSYKTSSKDYSFV